MIYWPAKRPGAVLDYQFNWAAALQAGETIATVTVTATGVVVDAVSHDTTTVTVKLSGGTLGTAGVVVCKITTNAVPARIDEDTAILPIGEEPVSLAMARAQCRADGVTTDDDYLLDLAQSAREHVEAYCGVRIAPAAVRMTFGSFAELERLSQAPIQSLVDVRYLDSAGVEQVLDPSVYELVDVDADPLRPALRPAFGMSWPSVRPVADAVRVNAVAGYIVVPRPIIRAMLLLIGQWYDSRSAVALGQTVVEIPNGVAALLANFRR